MALLKRLDLLPILLILSSFPFFAASPVAAQGTLTLTNGDSITISGSGTIGTLAGASVNNTTSAYDGVELAGRNTFNLSNGGSVGLLSTIYLDNLNQYFGSADINITGGTVSDGIDCEGCKLNITGGDIPATAFIVSELGNNYIGGGNIADEFDAISCNTIISGGTMGVFASEKGTTNIDGGTIDALEVDSGTVNITGGTINNLGFYGEGDTVGEENQYSSFVSISGGSICAGNPYITIGLYSTVTLDLFGSFVALDSNGKAVTGPITSGYGTIVGTLLNGEPLYLNYGIDSGIIEFNVGSAPSPPNSDRAINTVAPLDANYRYSHVDLSDNPGSVTSSVKPPLHPNAFLKSDYANLSNDTQLCYGAVADGATKVLLKYIAEAPGAVVFTEYNGVTGDSLVPLGSSSNTAATNQQVSVPTELINGQNVAYALYTVPESLDTTMEAQQYSHKAVQHNVSFTASYTATDNSVEESVTSLTLQSPPVLLVHGLWDDATGFLQKTGPFSQLKNFNFQIYIADYSNFNNASFEANETALLDNHNGSAIGDKEAEEYGVEKLGINGICKEYRDRGVAITKVDVVAHSLGGLVTRKFVGWSGYKD